MFLSASGIVGLVVASILLFENVRCFNFGEKQDELDYIQFKAWQRKYEKKYVSEEQHSTKFLTYQRNLRVITKLNEEHNGAATFEDNKFADISLHEFATTVLMRPRPPPQFEQSRYHKSKLAAEALPTSFTWKGTNKVTSVKNQGSAGTCWAFSTVANIEGQYAMAGHPATNLSVEQIVDCDDSSDPPKGYADCGVYGGWPYLAYQYVIRAGGLQRSVDYPYCAGEPMPKLCMVCPAGLWNDSLCGPPMPYCNMTQSCYAKLNPAKFVPGTALADWKHIDLNETVIAQELMNIGPLSVAMNAEMLQFYSKGIFNPIVCNKKNLDHAVLIVGFGDGKSIFGKDDPYWVVKNSWGPDWGEEGYFRVKRGEGVCGINTQVTSAILKKP